ncbi:hypothetical protein SEA_GRETCHEN_59 [Microbacterium phage Gretchen]|uniref:Uncharacterized protein n=1 Tax=Microbacterium phage Percival TaxID=2201439 RepID=A0A2Z4Q6M8_9CAUD|nr:hypothetical protein PBI_PERCIVAL_60 [Microbacterium phage Percival]UDL14833.1 hypothetical protein SEA_GRETCHEN_59 [Microbacterium phage Gretchen]
MPNLRVEEAARDHVYHLRHRQMDMLNLGPDDFILSPLIQKLDRAIAAVLEHLTDIGGGVEGVTYTHALLADYAMRLPGGPYHLSQGGSPALEQAREELHFDSVATATAPTPII